MAGLTAARINGASVGIAFGSITASFANVIAAKSGVAVVVLSNATDASIDVSLDGYLTSYVTPTFFISIPAGQVVTLDLRAAGLEGTVSVDIRYTSAAPTVRSFSAALIRRAA